MKTAIAIVLGYDNSLTKTNLQAIKLLKQTNNYELSLFYYLPKIPPEFYALSSVRQMAQEYRDEAARTLKSVSEELNIALPQIDHHIDFDNTLISGSSNVLYTVKVLNHHDVVLTGNPIKIKGLFFNLLTDWLKPTITGQPIQESYIFQPVTFLAKLPEFQDMNLFTTSPSKKLNKMVLTSKKQAPLANPSDASSLTQIKTLHIDDKSHQILKGKIAVNCF